jgi:methyl-accepting chemotaxis protein
VTQASLTSQPFTSTERWTLRHTLRHRQTLGLVLLSVLPVPLVTFLLAVSVNALNDRWMQDEETPAGLLQDLDGVGGQVLLLGILAGVLVFAVALLLATRLKDRANRMNNEQLERVLQFVYEMDAGNLAARLNAEPADEVVQRKLAEALNVMVDGVHRMTNEVKHATRGLNKAADDILEATHRQIDAATQQDSVVAQTTATVNEVRATVTETAERAQNVAENAQASIEVSRTGDQAVTDAIEGMHMIRRRVEDIADNILILSEHTQQIGEIIATVNSIADQSKMLALNASVEAARAGEEGKGFAVVAMEVRNLAEQSREATAQVRDILSEIQRATNAAVMVTEEGTKGVDRGVSLVDRAGKTIKELASTIEENAVAAVQIAASTRQQAVGMDQLTNAMRTIKDSTAEAASSSMQVERSVQQLQGVAEHLGATLNRYRL